MQPLPQCYETEKGLLGSFLSSEYDWNMHGYDINPDHIYNAQIQGIIRWMQQENCCDLSIIHDKFTVHAPLLAESMTNPVVRLSSAIKVIDETYRKREIIKIASEASQSLYKGTKSSDVVVAEFVEKCAQVALNEGSVEALSDILPRAAEGFKKRSEGGGVGLKTGFKDVDKKLGGMAPGDMVVVAGRPSQGKSSFVINMLKNVPYTSLVFSLEMDKTLVASRLITADGDVTYGYAKDDAVSLACARLKDKKIFIDDTPGISVGKIISRCKKIKAQHGLDLIVVDHVGLMGVERGRSENEEIGSIYKALKNLARELRCVAMPLSQLSRNVEHRPDKRPLLSDLRSSGVAEQDSDKVIMLYRPEYYNPNDCPGVAEILIRKNRNGQVGSVNLTFKKEYMKFTDYQESDRW